MTASPAAPAAAPAPPDVAPWTCPFCALHCDGFTPVAQGHRFVLQDSACPRADAALAHFAVHPQPGGAAAVGGQSAPLEQALDAAAAVLAQARLPLFGGLATDIAGSRALYRLADRCGAVLDHAHGDAQVRGLRALQDRGLLTTTLAEVRERADVIVCLGTPVVDRYPEFFRRCGVSGPAPAAPGATTAAHPAAAGDAAPPRQVHLVGTTTDAAALSQAGVPAVLVPLLPSGLFDTVALLAALVSQRRPAGPVPAQLAALAQRLREARYGVLVLDLAALPPHGELVAEAVHRLLDHLNRHTRAAALLLGGNDGAMSANQAVTWLSGLPLRTGVLARGLTHEPLAFAIGRLLAQSAVDALLWVSSFGPQLPPPATALPRVVLGHPHLAGHAAGARDVFIAVATPGIGSAAHMARFDSVVVLPLRALRGDGLPSVADVALALHERVGALRAARS